MALPKTLVRELNGIHYKKTSDVCQTSDVWETPCSVKCA
jgi:hypothetical protein